MWSEMYGEIVILPKRAVGKYRVLFTHHTQSVSQADQSVNQPISQSHRQPASNQPTTERLGRDA